MIAQLRWIHIWKALVFLRQMPNVTALSAHFGFFGCILKVWVIKRNQKLHENSWDIFEKVWIVCVECNKLDFLLDIRLGKTQDWHPELDCQCHGWTVDNFYVCIRIILSKLHSNVPLSYPFLRTWNFYEWLGIQCDKYNMVVIALEFVSLIHARSTFLYVLQDEMIAFSTMNDGLVPLMKGLCVRILF